MSVVKIRSFFPLAVCKSCGFALAYTSDSNVVTVPDVFFAEAARFIERGFAVCSTTAEPSHEEESTLCIS